MRIYDLCRDALCQLLYIRPRRMNLSDPGLTEVIPRTLLPGIVSDLLNSKPPMITRLNIWGLMKPRPSFHQRSTCRGCATKSQSASIISGQVICNSTRTTSLTMKPVETRTGMVMITSLEEAMHGSCVSKLSQYFSFLSFLVLLLHFPFRCYFVFMISWASSLFFFFLRLYVSGF